MSNWLFDNMGPGSAVAILPPSGTCFFELHEPRPLVCLVGPALGICRSAAASGARRRVHVDYSVSTRSEMICAEALSELASQHPTITCHTRITREEGRFQGADLARLSAELPDCDWLGGLWTAARHSGICCPGAARYQVAAVRSAPGDDGI